MSDPTPLRPDDQVVGGFIPVSLGGTEYNLPELPTGLNRAFRKRLAPVMDSIVGNIGSPKTLEEVAEQVNAHGELFLELLIAYDHSGVLPDREWIDAHATDTDIYRAIQQVTNAAFPFGNNLLELAMMQAAQKVRHSLRSTNGSPPSTAGRRRRSKAA